MMGRAEEEMGSPPMLQKHYFQHHYIMSPFCKQVAALPEAISGVSGYDPMSEDCETQAAATLLSPNGYMGPHLSGQDMEVCRQRHEASMFREQEGIWSWGWQ